MRGRQQCPFAASAALIACLSTLATAATLPDTGQDTCYTNAAADAVAASNLVSVARDGGSFPRQDCRYGADAAAANASLTKIGLGAKGFDYTKIANNGSALPAAIALGSAATDWACTRDNNTGLTWEVKTATSTHLRFSGHTYTWYMDDPTSNGGNNGSIDGSASANTCNGTLPANLCFTKAYITAVNAATLCGASDWRLPSMRELLSIVHFATPNPAIEPFFFSNTAFGYFWTGSTYAINPALVWVVGSTLPPTSFQNKSDKYAVRLVRGAAF